MLAGKEVFLLVRILAHPIQPSEKSYNQLRTLLMDHVKPQNFEMTERARFHSAIRQPGQSIREYILALQTQAAKCSFGTELESQLRDRLVAGLADQELQSKLLLEPDLTYARAKTMCERYNDVAAATFKEKDCLRVQSPRKFARSGNKATATAKNSKSFTDKAENAKGQMPTERSACLSCGGQHLRNECKLRNATCFQCGKQGHIKAVCRKAKESLLCDPERRQDLDNLDSFLALAATSNDSHHIIYHGKLPGGKNLSFIVDTGSQECLIAKATLLKIHPEAVVKPTSISIMGITGHQLEVLGKTEVPLVNDGSIEAVPLTVIH